ncbi:Thyroglobulin [Galemys pyrenaicus]|uniref:Thyroglobulin n=1 Tax=Galemys pyrenaicus TaxID=202257 RepID=A0A8J6DQ00_GALPY|nr:Thyroglobulin [Galemys pyrenaicus]
MGGRGDGVDTRLDTRVCEQEHFLGAFAFQLGDLGNAACLQRSGWQCAVDRLDGAGVQLNHDRKGGSGLSPAAVISPERARQQAATLAEDVGCPASSVPETLSCLRRVPTGTLNDAQTKLLAVSGPFHYWGPVVDGKYIVEAPTKALQRSPRARVDLLAGTSQDDGLITRAKAVKQFEESQGWSSSRTAFYRALQNALGGAEAGAAVRAAATWYYSLEHSEDDYASFSRALENATRLALLPAKQSILSPSTSPQLAGSSCPPSRGAAGRSGIMCECGLGRSGDYFITCPVIDMASHWARGARGNVFLYHAPESYGHSSLDLLADVQLVFGLPLHPAYEGQFTLEEKSLSLKVMQFFSNFIRSGNPNYPHEFSRKAPTFAAPWPDFIPSAHGESYKELSVGLPNRQGLKKADCSFWSKYIRALETAADEAKDGPSTGRAEEDGPADPQQREGLPGSSEPGSKSYSK